MKKFIAIACVIASVAFTGCTRTKKAWKEVNEQVNWTDNHQSKHHIYYDYINKEFIVTANSACQHIGQVFFPTEESAIDAVKTISEERLKKLFM